MRVLAFAVRAGRISDDDFRRVKVDVTAPSVAIANKAEEAQRYQLLVGMGLSRRTALAEQGYDPDVEFANTQAEQDQFPDTSGGFGTGGGLGGLLGESARAGRRDRRNVRESGPSGPSGPPPREGLVWKPSTHRWVHPETGKEYGHSQPHVEIKAAASTIHYHGPKSPGDGWTEVGVDRAGNKVWAPPALSAGEGRLVGKKDADSASDAGATTPATIQRRMGESPEYQAFGAKFDQRHDAEYAAMARSAGTTPDQVKAAIAAKAQAFADAHDVYMRMTPATLEKVLAGGRVKTQHETGTSHGVLDPALRRKAEADAMGVPADAPGAVRPLSGYLGKKDFAVGDTTWVANYGSVIIKPKAHVRDRSTVTFDDSLAMATNGTGAATPLGAVGHRSVNPRHYSADPNMLDSHEAFHGGRGYAEVQIHGGLSTADIEEVAFPTEPPPATVAALKEAGINWRVYDKSSTSGGAT